jgi:hypothetical protein
MLLSQTETYASVNYRSMTQARYAAESGVHKAINYLLNSYAAPLTDTDFAPFDTTRSPVLYNGSPVVLTSMAGVTANYPVGAIVTDFQTAAAGSLAVGGTSVGYTVTAKLLSMDRFTEYSTGVPRTVQTWEITADGTTTGARPGTVEVIATLEQQKIAFNMYGFFATNPNCGALIFAGGVTTDSYDSSTMHNASGGAVDASNPPATQADYGNVGTNGNLTEGGGSVVNGTLSTPRTGVGHCTGGAVDALTQNGNTVVTGGLVALPQPVNFTTPALPNPMPPIGNVNGNSCAGLGIGGLCTTVSGNPTLHPLGTPLVLGDVKLTAGASLHLTSGVYNLNSISLQGNSSIVIDSGPVVFNVAGIGQNTPIDFSGGVVMNGSYVPGNFQMIYGGTDTLKITGGTETALTTYAPNAAVQLVGGSSIYGSIMGATIDDHGGVGVHYDRNLPAQFAVSWNNMMSGFSWKKY